MYPIILLDIKPLITIKPSWPSGLRRSDFPVVDWRGVGSNPAGDIYFHFELFAPSPFWTGQRSQCKWNQACQFTWSHSCFRPQIWFIIQGLVYKYLQYSFKVNKRYIGKETEGCKNEALTLPIRYRSVKSCSFWWLPAVTTAAQTNSIRHRLLGLSPLWRRSHRGSTPVS